MKNLLLFITQKWYCWWLQFLKWADVYHFDLDNQKYCWHMLLWLLHILEVSVVISELARQCFKMFTDPIYPTPPLGQDMTQGQFLSGV